MRLSLQHESHLDVPFRILSIASFTRENGMTSTIASMPCVAANSSM